MYVEDLLGALHVEAVDAVTGRSVHSLFEVRVQAGPCTCSFLRDAILVVYFLGLLGGLVLGVELLEGVGEAAGEAMLIVETNSTLDGFVADGVALG